MERIVKLADIDAMTANYNEMKAEVDELKDTLGTISRHEYIIFTDGVGEIALGKVASKDQFFHVSFDINTSNSPIYGYAMVNADSNILKIYAYVCTAFGTYNVFTGNSYCTITGILV